MQHFDGARLSPNSFRNAVRHALNEPVCLYLRTRNPRCSTVYIDNSLGPLARGSLCIIQNCPYTEIVTHEGIKESGFGEGTIPHVINHCFTRNSEDSLTAKKCDTVEMNLC